METKLDELLHNLRELSKAYDRLSRAVPDPRTAEHQADVALSTVLNDLKDPEIKGVIETLIPEARKLILSDLPAFRRQMVTQRAELVKVETKIVQHSGTRRRDIETLYARAEISREVSDYVSDVDSLCEQLESLHKLAKEQIHEARRQPRLKKKKRKHNVAQAITSAIFGTAVITANIQLPIVFAFSYGLGGSALHQAFRDVVGAAE